MLWDIFLQLDPVSAKTSCPTTLAKLQATYVVRVILLCNSKVCSVAHHLNSANGYIVRIVIRWLSSQMRAAGLLCGS